MHININCNVNYLQVGVLNKLAKVSGRNWKDRYFILTPISLLYFVDEKASKKGISSRQGESQISGDSSVEAEEHVDGQGFSFRLTTPWESMKLAASSEAERSSWMKWLKAVIDSNKYSLRGSMLKVGGLMSQKKYFILREDTLTMHADLTHTGKV